VALVQCVQVVQVPAWAAAVTVTPPAWFAGSGGLHRPEVPAQALVLLHDARRHRSRLCEQVDQSPRQRGVQVCLAGQVELKHGVGAKARACAEVQVWKLELEAAVKRVEVVVDDAAAPRTHDARQHVVDLFDSPPFPPLSRCNRGRQRPQALK
jgi:hypothetical protein